MRRLVTVVLFLVLLGGCGGVSDGFGNDGDATPATQDPSFGAQDVCHQFVKERLKAPTTAGFEKYGEATFVQTGSDVWRVAGHVDAENSFGAKIRSDYTCQVRHGAGAQWQLVDLNIEGR